MKEIPFTNNDDHAVHIGNKMVPPHETRMVDPSMLPDAHEGNEAPEQQAPDPLLSILDGSVADVAEALPGLSDEEIDTLEQAELDGKARKGVEQAIAEVRLTRASSPDGGQNGNDDDSGNAKD